MPQDPDDRLAAPPGAGAGADDQRMERILRDLAVADDCTRDDAPGLPGDDAGPSGGAPTVGGMTAIATLGAVALDCREPRKVAEFYSAVLGVPIARDDEDWVQLAPTGGAALAFQLAPDHRPPEWPGAEHPQQMHLDLDVPDLDAAEPRVLELGARKHPHQPSPDDFRVFLDPAGHPFCLCRT